MKNKIITFVLAFVLCISFASAGLYTIDGDMSDWGVSFSDISIGLCELNYATNTCSNNITKAEEAWVPSSSSAEWIVENNRDPAKIGFAADWTLYKATGVHIISAGTSYAAYDEPVSVPTLLEPIGGDKFDIEAVYFDNDNESAYFAVVTSMPPTSFTDYQNITFWMGDLSMDVVNKLNESANYGLAFVSHTIIPGDSSGIIKGDVCKNPDWIDATPYPQNSPAYMKNCDDPTGSATVVYRNITSEIGGLEGYSGITSPAPTYVGLHDTWLIEVELPLSAIEKDGDANGKINLHSTMSCGNDVIEIGDSDNWYFGEIPEMGTIAAILAVFGVGFGFYTIKKRR